jgi:hypothetical protein
MKSKKDIEKVLGIYPFKNYWGERQYVRHEVFSHGVQTFAKMFASFWFIWIIYLDYSLKVAYPLVIVLFLLQYLILGSPAEVSEHPSYSIEA